MTARRVHRIIRGQRHVAGRAHPVTAGGENSGAIVSLPCSGLNIVITHAHCGAACLAVESASALSAAPACAAARRNDILPGGPPFTQQSGLAGAFLVSERPIQAKEGKP